MSKKTSYIIIFSLLVVLTVGIIFTDYVKQLGTILADASVPNPGHSLSEIEGYENLATKAYVDTAVSGASSKWTLSGSNIYRSSGNVGIGMTTPGYKLDVSGTGRFTGTVIVGAPTSSSHAATKEYVDSRGLPTGGTNGAVLRWTDSGPIWDSPLTWDPIVANRKTAFDCSQIGGTVYDTGGGKTICRVPASTVPAGWTQAASWQRYSPAEWGGDMCGNHKSSGPATFQNADQINRSGGTTQGCVIEYCPGMAGAAGCCSWTSASSCWMRNTYNYCCPYPVISTITNGATNRVEIGVY